MKTVLNLVLVSTLIITSGNLFGLSAFDSSDVNFDPQGSVDETSPHDVEIAAKANETLQKSEMALENVMKDPDNSIPPSLISKSEGVVIFPKAFKLALGAAGGQGGRGIAMIRQDDGSWSNPIFVTLGEGSVGFQIGAQKSDIVMLFKNRNDLLTIDNADIMIGSGIGVAAGPLNKDISATTDITFESEIYSYQCSKGLFAGISLKGGILSNSSGYNESFYWMDDVNTDEIFNEIEAPYNGHVSDLIETLNMYGE